MIKPKLTTNLRKLKAQLKNIPTDRQAVAYNLFDELVFMQNTLDELKAQVAEQGAVDLFQQGRQKFLREHPAMKVYNTTIQRYSLINKQIIDLLPKVEQTQAEDALTAFLSK